MAYIPPKPTGTTREAIFLSWVWETLVKLQKISGGPGVSVNQTTRGITISVPAKQQCGGSATIQRVESGSTKQMKLVALTVAMNGDAVGTVVGNELIYCVSFENGVEGATVIPVAKPFWLRRSSVASRVVTLPDGDHSYSFTNGYTRLDNRTKNGTTTQFTEVIWPPYSAGDVICVTEPVGLNKAYTDASNTQHEVLYEDTNSTGRTWAWQDTYCTNGVSKSIYVVGSKPF